MIAYHFKAFVEIVILWYAIYMVLLFIKGSRSEQLLRGLLIIGVMFVVTQELRLDVINWALTRIFPISVIALIVIFQPEMRRGLAQLGKFGIHQQNAEAIDEISKAAAGLSRKKVGALVVIERETGLKSYIESGVRIDSRVSGYLISSIFMPQSPLHDGALIVERGRIVAAGCILPLPEDEKALSKSLGMRHRAAIGITEETDAVSVVVSEETGAISIAHGGRLSHDLEPDAVARMLKNMFAKPKGRRAILGIRMKNDRVS